MTYKKIKLNDVKHKALVRFSKIVKEDEVEFIRTIIIKNKEHKLYQVGKVFVLTVDENLITEWDEEFEHVWNTYLNNQNNQK